MTYSLSKENIWHFTCLSCKGFWSIATMDNWVPKELFCPHCGKKQKNDSEVLSEDGEDTIT